MSDGLFGQDFNIEIKQPDIKELVKKAVKKEKAAPTTEKILKSKKVTLQDKLDIINDNVLRVLGKQKDKILVIKDIVTFTEYITKAIESKIIALDTETNNTTDAANSKLMGLCLYYPGGKAAYVPVNHVNLETKERLSWQMTENNCQEQLARILKANMQEIIMHNGKFDYEVIKVNCGLKLAPTWDTLVAARQIDENRFRDKTTGLKYIYTTCIDSEQEKYSIESLFENIPYQYVSPEIFALYSAFDPKMTYDVYKWEKETFFDLPENRVIYNLFRLIEIPIIEVTAEIELKGVYIDQEFGKMLKEKYSRSLVKLDDDINKIIESIKPEINAWKETSEATDNARVYVSAKTKMSKEKIEEKFPNIDANGKRYKIGKSKALQLEDPINLGSTSQLAILFYDICKCPIVNLSSPRATGEEDLEAIVAKITNIKDEQQTKLLAATKAICEKMLERRGIVKLISTYIDVIPDLAKHWKDGRIRYRLNSTGTDTGRFSSGGKYRFLDENENPVEINSINSQNIPSKGDGAELRLLFKAPKGYKLVGSDYSGQELRLAAFISQDKTLLKAYEEDKDVYAVIAQQVFNCKYEDCLEFYPAGTKLNIDGKEVIAGHKTHLNKDGKGRRNTGKTMVLAGNYGMSGAGAGALMGKTAKEGTDLLDKYFKMFDGLAGAIEESKKVLRKQGYVTGLLGRRRRLPDINLKPYEVKYNNTAVNTETFNPILDCANRKPKDDPELIWNMILDAYGIMATAQHIARNKPYEIGAMSNMAFEKLKAVAANPSKMLDAKYSTNKFAKFTNKEKIINDLNTTFKGIIFNHRYKGTAYEDKVRINIDASLADEQGCFINQDLAELVYNYKEKYDNQIPTNIPLQKVDLFAWTGRIAQAERQCFNARIQGSAGTLTKKAMIDIYNDPEMQRLGAELILSIHDEVLVECPEENAEAVMKRLPELMIRASLELGIEQPKMKCDPMSVSRWYADVEGAAIQDEFKKLVAKGISHDEALKKVVANRCEFPPEAVINVIRNGGDLEF